MSIQKFISIKLKKIQKLVNYKPIIIVAGEPNSVFFELFFKVIKKKIKSPIILIASKKIITKQAKILKQKISFNITNESEIIKKKIV